VPDFEAEGLLDGLEGEQRAGRLALLERLHADGVPLEDLRRAVAEERLVLLPLERVLGGVPRLTAREVAEEAGIDLGLLLAGRGSLGLPQPDPDERVMGDAELEAARRFASTLDLGMPAEGMVDLNRVLGRAMAQVAAAMRQLFGDTYIQPGDREDELADRYATMAELLLPNLGPALQNIFALHLRELLRSAAIDAAARERGTIESGDRLAVAFADLVGFTSLGGQVPADELGRVARRLERLAADAVRPPVRLVKTIGDAVLLVSPAPGPLLDAVLELVAAAEREGEEFPQLRAGLTWGEARERDGDVYGHAVNLASRIAGRARPGSVLVDDATHDALRDGGYRWSYAGARKLKNVPGEARLFRARAGGGP
jgi:adenylate cyclase